MKCLVKTVQWLNVFNNWKENMKTNFNFAAYLPFDILLRFHYDCALIDLLCVNIGSMAKYLKNQVVGTG